MLKASLVLTVGMSLAQLASARSILTAGHGHNNSYGTHHDDDEDDYTYGHSYGYNSKYSKPNFPNHGSILTNAKIAKDFCRQNPNAIRCDDDGNYHSTQHDKLIYLEQIEAKNAAKNAGKSSGPAPVQTPPPAPAAQQIAVDGVLYPVCSNQAIDPENDGWGWENERTCVFTYGVCSSAASDADGDGWGWENNKSCRVK